VATDLSVALSELASASWCTSSHSGSAGNCVEVAHLPVSDSFAVRSTRSRTAPPQIYSRPEWDAFIAGAKDGEFDIPPATWAGRTFPG
jgi:Domain of unknown function (DUF397)